jgi:lipoprotein-anchoring transpeptidase ErfK/SrfK
MVSSRIGLLQVGVAATALSLVAAVSGRAWSEPALPQSLSPAAPVRSGPQPRVKTQSDPVALASPVERKQRSAAHAPRTDRPRPALLAAVPRTLPIRARPGGGRVVGEMPAGSPFYGIPTMAWIHRRDGTGRFGLVTVPYSATRATGWIRIAELELGHTRVTVRADLSRREIAVMRLDKVIMRFPATIGSPATPTPPGRYFVTDRVPFSPGSPLGAFAFGISGIQPHLPPGWRGGNQLAIHGTNYPSSIGEAASAGCLRVSRRALERLKPLLTLGTPVTIRP